MRLLYLAALSAGCGFEHGIASLPAGDDQPPGDAPGMIDAAIDARPIDARELDAFIPPTPVTTNHPSTADTFLASDAATTNFNDQTSALVDGDTQRVVVIKFDLSAIPMTSTVTAATMHIWTDFDPGGHVTIYPLLESWDETQATWNNRANGMAWTAAGAAPPSRGTTMVGQLDPGTQYTEYVVTIDTATVAGWVANPATNVGLVFTTTQADGTRFSTREFATATSRPYLAVTHAP